MHRRIILDCGSHLGESVAPLKRICEDGEVFMFEPNPHLFKIINNTPAFKDCKKINYAVSNKDGIGTFWGCMEDQLSVGATMEKSKADFDKINNSDYIEVPTIDLSNFIINNFNATDFIVLKLDVEGSEYDVLDRLIQTDVIARINKLYCEFHKQWLDPLFAIREKEILKKLNDIGLLVEPWDAL